MYVGRDFDPTDPGENEIFSFDFVNDLDSNESLQSATWTCAAVTGSDPAAASRISGSASAAGTQTSQRIAGLLPGVR